MAQGSHQGPPEAFVTQPVSWTADVLALEHLIHRLATRGPDGRWPEHPLFGSMSGRDWGVFIHKHFDHHFTQFGI